MAATFFRRSLAEDDVDRYSNTWAVTLFSSLALVFFLVPISPVTLDATQSVSRFGKEYNGELTPKVKASCWSPAHHEPSQVRYTDAFCSREANMMLRGVNTTSQYVSSPSESPSWPSGRQPLPLLSATDATVRASADRLERRQRWSVRHDDFRQKVQVLIHFKTPLALFLLALCLALPRFLGSILRNAATFCIDVHQVLESCVASRRLDVAGQRSVYDATAMAAAESTRQSRNTATTLYVCLKLSTFLVIILEILFVTHFIMADIQDSQAMEKELVDYNSSGNAISLLKHKDPTNNLTNSVYRCFVEIKHLTYTHNFTVPCMITPVETGDASDVRIQARPLTNHSVLSLYRSLFSCAVTLLVILAVVNVFNTIAWLRKLIFNSHATSMGLPSNAAKDVVLLVHMAWLNAGPMVARGLAGSSAWSGGPEETHALSVEKPKAPEAEASL